MKVDPSDHNYFNSPHRINGHGIYTGHHSPSVKKKMQFLLNGDSTTYDQRQYMGDTNNKEDLGTTYKKFFSPSK